jgi:REP element-mobilizing transposase RayT
MEREEKSAVQYAIKHFESERYDLIAYNIMDDHVHIIISTRKYFTPERIIHSWKSFTAYQFQWDFNRSGSIWQRDYFDRIIRTEAEWLEKIQYVLNNPKKRWPEIQDYEWTEFCL